MPGLTGRHAVVEAHWPNHARERRAAIISSVPRAAVPSTRGSHCPLRREPMSATHHAHPSTLATRVCVVVDESFCCLLRCPSLAVVAWAELTASRVPQNARSSAEQPSVRLREHQGMLSRGSAGGCSNYSIVWTLCAVGVVWLRCFAMCCCCAASSRHPGQLQEQ